MEIVISKFKIVNVVKTAIIFVCCITLCGCEANTNLNVEYIDVEQFQEELILGTTFNVLIMRDDCEYCEELKKYLQEAKTDQIRNLKILEYTQENREEVVSILEEELPNFKQIPYLGKIRNGKVTEGIIDIPINDDIWGLLK